MLFEEDELPPPPEIQEEELLGVGEEGGAKIEEDQQCAPPLPPNDYTNYYESYPPFPPPGYFLHPPPCLEDESIGAEWKEPKAIGLYADNPPPTSTASPASFGYRTLLQPPSPYFKHLNYRRLGCHYQATPIPVRYCPRPAHCDETPFPQLPRQERSFVVLPPRSKNPSISSPINKGPERKAKQEKKLMVDISTTITSQGKQKDPSKSHPKRELKPKAKKKKRMAVDIPHTITDARERKKFLARAKAAKLKKRLAEIELKPENDRSDEERQLYSKQMASKIRKNARNRQRTKERREEIDRILAKPSETRTKMEEAYLVRELARTNRKLQRDRERRALSKKTG